jgi:hypothetical protein
MTTFVDFVAATGTARLTRVRDAKRFYEAEYGPERDFYKAFRDRAEDCLATGWNGAKLTTALAQVTDPKKVDNYEECRKGLTKWVGRKTITTLPAVRTVWRSGSLRVAVNPELHADVAGTPHLVKFYLKSEPLSKQKADILLHLLGKQSPSGTTVGVLDVRRARLHVPTRTIAGMDALLKGEAQALTTIWQSI